MRKTVHWPTDIQAYSTNDRCKLTGDQKLGVEKRPAKKKCFFALDHTTVDLNQCEVVSDEIRV